MSPHDAEASVSTWWSKWRRWQRRRRGKRLGIDRLRRRGDQLRMAGRHYDAGVLYAAAVDVMPDARLRVQAGHMFKEAGDLAAAEEQYLAAADALPEDADLALQLGHFNKVAGRFGEATRWYRRAGELKPGWADALRELERLGVRPHDADDQPFGPERGPTQFVDPLETVVLRHFGGLPRHDEPRGVTALRGVESIRGICVATRMLDCAELWLDGACVAVAPIAAGNAVTGGRKHAFNLWYDFSTASRGMHRVEVRLTGGERDLKMWRDAFIGAPLLEAEHPDSDAVVDGPIEGEEPLDRWLHRRTSMVRPARAHFLDRPIGCIMVVRADQLGDMVVSVPALRRLRALAPEARLVGLLTAANADLARTLGLFDAIEVMSWDAAAPPGQRRLTPGEERRLASILPSYGADVAIDLLVDGASRPLLALTGAPCTIGFEDEAWPWLTVGVSGRSHDARTGHEAAPHAARLLSLVERFGTLLDSGSAIVPPADGGRERLAAFGLHARAYAVLHTGGRYGFSRWPGYAGLAQRLLAETTLNLIVFGDTNDLAQATRSDGRLTVIDRELAFDDFDALLGHAAVFIGNDSGPKHLAALRGTPVVSVHSSRIDWREWGQSQTGLVVSRRLPCAGCSLNADRQDECGRDFACIADIGVDEVFAAVRTLL